MTVNDQTAAGQLLTFNNLYNTSSGLSRSCESAGRNKGKKLKEGGNKGCERGNISLTPSMILV
jgi:hypothetical protein